MLEQIGDWLIHVHRSPSGLGLPRRGLFSPYACSLVHNMVSCPRSLSHPKEGVKQDVMASKEFSTLRPGGVQE